MRKLLFVLSLLLVLAAAGTAQSVSTQYQTVTTLMPAMVQQMCHNGTSQFVQVVAAPGAGNLIVADSVYVNLQYAGTAYAPNPLGNPSPMALLFFGGDTVFSGIFTVQDFKTNSNSIMRVTTGSGLYSFLNGWAGPDIGAALYIAQSGGCFINGNSPIVVTVNYHIIAAA